MDGIINIYKEKGFTSHDVVAKLRGILHQKKIGHTGTLDPDATGVLPVCLGRATKVCSILTERTKAYTAVVKLGVVTDTQDMTGAVQEEHDVDVSPLQIKEAADAFVGEIWQTPPMYSAVKVNGKRLYELARQGLEVERKKRKITIYSCQVTAYDAETHEFTMEVVCSKGTYIRTLCQDIGERLSCGACMASLVRTEVEPFSIESACTLSQVEALCREGRLNEVLIPVDHIFTEFSKVIVSDEGMRFLLNGNDIKYEDCQMPERVQPDELVRMYDKEHRFYAIYRYNGSGRSFTCYKMFFTDTVQQKGMI